MLADINFILFFIAVTLAVILLAFHTYLTNGKRVTFTFFLFAFIWAFMKESALPFSPMSPYEFLLENISMTLVIFTVIFGWLFTFYISWRIADNILERIVFFKKSLFMTLLLGMWITASISYAVESTGIHTDWWKWKIDCLKFSDFLVPAYSYNAAGGWIDFFIYFMLAYFLIECSKYKTAAWKSIFFLMPVAFVLFLRDVIMARMLVITAVIVLAFLNPLKLSYEKNKTKTLAKYSSMIDYLPLAMTVFMILIIGLIDILVIKQPLLLFSKLPIAFCVLFAIKEIPFVALVILSIILLALGGKLVIPALILTIFILLLKIMDWLQVQKNNLYAKIIK